MNAITIGLDIAKSVFQVHGEDASGRIVLQKRLRRPQVEAFPLRCAGVSAARQRMLEFSAW
jgi:transposase